MATTILLLLLSVFFATTSPGAEGAAGGGPARGAADYLAETTWVCTMPQSDPYEAHRCSPDPLALPCTAEWLARCERVGGALRTCGAHECDDVYVGKRARRDDWMERRLRRLRRARHELRRRAARRPTPSR